MAIELPRIPLHIFDSLEPHLAQQLSDWFERAHAKFDQLEQSIEDRPEEEKPEPSLIVGLDGKDGNGVEYVFTCTTEEVLPESQRPLNSWPFDQSSLSETSVNGQRWHDGAPPGVGVDAELALPILSAECPVLWRSQRRVPGTPAAGTPPDEETWGEWSEPIIIGRYGVDGKPGPRGLAGYTHYVMLTNYELTPGAVNADEDWNFTGGDTAEWAQTVTLIWEEADADIIAAVNRIRVGTLFTIFKDGTNWADYRSTSLRAIGHRVTMQGTLQEKVGKPEFAHTDNGEVHFSPAAEVQIGHSGATVSIYKRSAAQPTDRPDDAIFNFSTRQLTPVAALGTLRGWSTTRPTGTERLWVRTAFAAGQGIVSDRINSNEWSEPVHDEAEDGISVWPLFLFQRRATKPTARPGRSTFNFATKFHDVPISNGWSKTIPDTGDPLWVTRATASSDDPLGTDTIEDSEWSIEPLSRDGRPGTSGVRVFVYKRSIDKPSSSDRPPDSTYFFNTRVLTPLSAGSLGGWQINEEVAGTDEVNGRIWTRTAWASANNGEDRDIIRGADWTSPIHDEGKDGINSIPLFLWKRSPVRPTVKPGKSTYRFSTKDWQTPNLNGWQRSIPDHNGDPLWICIAKASSDTDFDDDIPSSEWSIEPLAEDGIQGPSGYGASVILENYQATAQAVNLDEEWFFTGGTGSTWPATIPVLTLRETDASAIAAFRLVSGGSLIAIHRHQDSANFGEYRVGAVPTVADNGMVSFAGLTRQRAEGAPNFKVGETGEIHFNPKGEPGEAAEPDPVLGIIDKRHTGTANALTVGETIKTIAGGTVRVTQPNRVLVLQLGMGISVGRRDGEDRYSSTITFTDSAGKTTSSKRDSSTFLDKNLNEYLPFLHIDGAEVPVGDVTITCQLQTEAGSNRGIKVKDVLLYAQLVKKGDFTPSGTTPDPDPPPAGALALAAVANHNYARGANVNIRLSVSGGTAPYTFTLPATGGLTLNVDRFGVITGGPIGNTRAGEYTVTARVTDSANPNARAERTFKIIVPPRLTNSLSDIAVTVGQTAGTGPHLDFAPRFAGEDPNMWLIVSSNPSVVSVNQTGTSSVARFTFHRTGTADITVTARNAAGNASDVFRFTVSAAATITTDTITRYARAASQPSAPSTSAQTPGSLWTLTIEPAPTSSLAVWRIIGTRTYRNGVFQSTSWAIDKRADATGTSSSVTATVTPNPVNPGINQIATVVVTGATSFTLQWQLFDNTWQDITGATRSTYQPIPAQRNFNLRCKVTAGGVDYFSNTVRIGS